MGKSQSDNYSADEVRALVELYEEISDAGRPFIVVRVADLHRSLRRLSPTLRSAVLTVGLLGLSITEAGKLTHCDRSTAYRRYERGLEALTAHMNGRRPN